MTWDDSRASTKRLAPAQTHITIFQVIRIRTAPDLPVPPQPRLLTVGYQRSSIHDPGPGRERTGARPALTAGTPLASRGTTPYGAAPLGLFAARQALRLSPGCPYALGLAPPHTWPPQLSATRHRAGSLRRPACDMALASRCRAARQQVRGLRSGSPGYLRGCRDTGGQPGPGHA